MPGLMTKRERMLIYITAAVVVCGVLLNILILPVLKKYELLNKETNIIRTRLVRYTQLLSQRENIEKEYESFLSNIKFSDRQQDALVTVLSELEDLAKAANIRIIDVRPQSQQAETAYKEILVDLKTQGDMQGYMKFIYDVENSLLLLRIKRFRLSSKPNMRTLEGNFSILN